MENIGRSEEHQKKSLAINERIGDVKKQFISPCNLALARFSQAKFLEALCYLMLQVFKNASIYEGGFLRKNDQFKISFSDANLFTYWNRRALVCVAENSDTALYVSELGRARALADLMSAPDSSPVVSNKKIMKINDKWISDFQTYDVEEIDWSKTYSLPFLCTRESKLRIFQFKLIHRRISTNRYLFKVGL